MSLAPPSICIRPYQPERFLLFNVPHFYRDITGFYIPISSSLEEVKKEISPYFRFTLPSVYPLIVHTQLAHSFALSLTALLIYDYMLTFSMEVERFWVPHKISATTTLYFVNRYAGLVGYMPILYQFLAKVGDDVCHSILTSPLASNLAPVPLTGVSAIECLSR